MLGKKKISGIGTQGKQFCVELKVDFHELTEALAKTNFDQF